MGFASARAGPGRPTAAGHGPAGGARRAPRLLAPLAAHSLATQPGARLHELGHCVFFAQTAPESGGSAPRCPGCARLRWGRRGPVGPPCSSAWPPCSPKVSGRRATSGPGTNFAGSECVGVHAWLGWLGERAWVCVCACARARADAKVRGGPFAAGASREDVGGRP